ncbi:RluA family pseudouridine synthase [Tuwongella immobilis]|uniref:Pseudouridine synthase RsuA/RluA-like domain-containing protein n=1 Tax=Tuwongella immobilis TaxID=692036 RepID=A0A6C2YR15_9BACT|nr:RluA family pseudouridine synthase [Tuwongella immobilis]VIP04088.1 ribosomal large subunit pseudouridine synthase d : Pseudouridine synthase OS=Pirellula staleyi (strain ATCC 27377 / DSM 6068 / ICPB 4128) GN=Psta_0906 PE=3 SV=1: PseudoU_synth_2 [Tuwongella immobilis]VTS05543.1 ribosomal large subunit pseudouridine synthase d : Pseudouridine synthase OS=Pirellula staleyi (strain ATCC 27377 / DSM 6068 / ICPB 4128) GN=Psta_0906 PE=3 SV=1: PseudoU_synth_2 [Tuwongella immobilis]
MTLPEPWTITDETAGVTLAAALRAQLPDQSWSQLKRLIEGRRVTIDDALCMDPARRVKTGEQIALRNKPIELEREATIDGLTIRYFDEHLIVVEKPSGISTVRHPAELEWNERRRGLSPTLDDLTQGALGQRLRRDPSSLQRLRIVQRLDKETSGLVVFARSIDAERELGRQFREHTVLRRYLAIVPGRVVPQVFRSHFVRDRGDGRRGSTTLPNIGKLAITHISIFEQLPNYTILECRLETGKTHQIRIHLSEAGHPVCGEPVYNRRINGDPIPDASDAPRLALHARELGFVHPISGLEMRWEMPLPPDLQAFVERLRGDTPLSQPLPTTRTEAIVPPRSAMTESATNPDSRPNNRPNRGVDNRPDIRREPRAEASEIARPKPRPAAGNRPGNSVRPVPTIRRAEAPRSRPLDQPPREDGNAAPAPRPRGPRINSERPPRDRRDAPRDDPRDDQATERPRGPRPNRRDLPPISPDETPRSDRAPRPPREERGDRPRRTDRRTESRTGERTERSGDAARADRPRSQSRPPRPTRTSDRERDRDTPPEVIPSEARRPRPPRADRPNRGQDGERPRTDRPSGERRTSRRTDDRPPRGDRPSRDNRENRPPRADRPRDDRPRSERPRTERPRAERPNSDRPPTDRPRTERPRDDRPRTERPRAERTGDAKPRSGDVRRGKPPRPSGDGAPPTPRQGPRPTPRPRKRPQ